MSSITEIETEPQPTKPKKKENLKQRAYLNSVTSVIDYGAKTITGFIVTPFIVNGLGSMLFGVWQILGQFASYTNMADIRVTQVLKWAVARDRDAKSDEELRQYVTATFLLVLLVLPFLLIAGAVITWFAPVITNVDPEYNDIVRITCALLILGLIIQKLFGIFESILRGMNLGFKRMGFRAVLFMIGGGLKIAVILLGYGLIGLALVQIFVALSIGITLYVVVKSNVPWFGWGNVDFKKSLSFLKVSGWFMGWTGVKLLLTRSDKILLGFFAGPILVTQYVITKYLVNTVQGMVGNVVHGVIPGMGKLYGNKEYDKLMKVREHVMLLTWLLAVTIGSLVIIFNESFLLLWIGEGHFAGQVTNVLIIIMIVQFIFSENDRVIVFTTLDISKMVYMGLASATISIGFIAFLVGDYGIIGLCIGLILGRMIMTIGYPSILYNKTGKTFKVSDLPFRIVCITILIWTTAIWLNTIFETNSWVDLILKVVLFGLAFLVIGYFGGLKNRQRIEIKDYFLKVKFFKKDV